MILATRFNECVNRERLPDSDKRLLKDCFLQPSDELSRFTGSTMRSCLVITIKYESYLRGQKAKANSLIEKGIIDRFIVRLAQAEVGR